MRKTMHVNLIITNIDDNLNWNGVKFPSSNADIQKLEDNNEGKSSVSVFHISSELQSETILLYRRSKVAKATYEVDLLKFEDGDNSHYVYIKIYSCLMSSQNNQKKVANHFCRHCSYGFGSEELLKKHKEKGCMATEGQQVKMPELDPNNPDKFYITF